jgi:uncharacterized integral membrane protein
MARNAKDMMPTPKIGYVELHRPGQWTIFSLFFVIIFVIIFAISSFASLSISLLPCLFVILPIIILLIDVRSRRRVLKAKKLDELATQLQKLSLRWLYFKSGKGITPWQREELGLPQTIADSSMKEALEEICIPQGLVEPELVRTSNPVTILGCILGGILILFFVSVGISLIMNSRNPTMSITGWFVTLAMLWNLPRLILGLPILHRSRNMPPLLRAIGRGKIIGKSFVAGPGWVKFGKDVWRCDRDMLLIRRTGYRSASTEIECLLVGPEKRRGLKFSGLKDDDFKILFGAWHVDDMRFEFIESELS